MSTTDETFEQVESGSSQTTPVQAGQLKKGDHVVINGFPCKVIDISVSKTGKHGHAKASITALDIFTNKKLEDTAPTSHNLEQPVVTSTEYQLIDIEKAPGSSGKKTISLLNDDNVPREDLNLPDGELGDQIQAAFDSGAEVKCVVVKAMGKEQVMSFKNDRAGA